MVSNRATVCAKGARRFPVRSHDKHRPTNSQDHCDHQWSGETARTPSRRPAPHRGGPRSRCHATDRPRRPRISGFSAASSPLRRSVQARWCSRETQMSGPCPTSVPGLAHICPKICHVCAGTGSRPVDCGGDGTKPAHGLEQQHEQSAAKTRHEDGPAVRVTPSQINGPSNAAQCVKAREHRQRGHSPH